MLKSEDRGDDLLELKLLFRPRRLFNYRLIHYGRYHDKNAVAVAMDCGTVKDYSGIKILARVSIVDKNLKTLYNMFVRPTAPVVDYRTPYSGVRPSDMVNAVNFSVAQAKVSRILSGALLVGHRVHHDLTALKLTHPDEKIRDTSSFGQFVRENGNRMPKLRDLTVRYLREYVQDGEHDCVEDAKAAMKLYLRYMN